MTHCDKQAEQECVTVHGHISLKALMIIVLYDMTRLKGLLSKMRSAATRSIGLELLVSAKADSCSIAIL